MRVFYSQQLKTAIKREQVVARVSLIASLFRFQALLNGNVVMSNQTQCEYTKFQSLKIPHKCPKDLDINHSAFLIEESHQVNHQSLHQVNRLQAILFILIGTTLIITNTNHNKCRQLSIGRPKDEIARRQEMKANMTKQKQKQCLLYKVLAYITVQALVSSADMDTMILLNTSSTRASDIE